MPKVTGQQTPHTALSRAQHSSQKTSGKEGINTSFLFGILRNSPEGAAGIPPLLGDTWEEQKRRAAHGALSPLPLQPRVRQGRCWMLREAAGVGWGWEGAEELIKTQRDSGESLPEMPWGEGDVAPEDELLQGLVPVHPQAATPRSSCASQTQLMPQNDECGGGRTRGGTG